MQEALYRPLAELALTCDGRPGEDCGKVLERFRCAKRPDTFEVDVYVGTGKAPGEGMGDETVEMVCASCGGSSAPINTALIVGFLQRMVDAGRRKGRVSCSRLRANSL